MQYGRKEIRKERECLKHDWERRKNKKMERKNGRLSVGR